MKTVEKVIYVGAPVGFEAAKEVLAGFARLEHVKAEPAELAAALREANALLDASMKVNISNEMLAGARGLRVISCATTGSDHISRGVLDERGVPVYTLKEDPELLTNLTPAAELSWALLMACARRLPAAVHHVANLGWNREEFPGVMLNGKRLGLIGCGRIGGWMARYGRAFSMEVCGYDPCREDWPETVVPAALPELMSTSDFIAVHVPLTPDTEGLVSRELLSIVKPGCALINTSRGAVVDEAALLDGLKSGRIGGVGLDVLTDEPDIAENPLVLYAKEHDNILITPHCGGFSLDAVRLVCRHAAGKIKAYLS